jgi:hypothetical protein
MAIQFEDILAVLCPSGFELKHATDFQKHYLVADDKEAKLAFDVLVSYGFDVKVYPDEETSGAKLYITLGGAEQATTEEQRMLASMAYGNALGDIKLRLDALCEQESAILQSPNYTLTFANAAQGAKQILITVSPAVAVVAAPVQSAGQPQQAQAATAARPAVRKVVKKKEDDGFNQGPAIAKQLYTGKPGNKGGQGEPDDFRQRMFLFITGNLATGGAGVLGMGVLLFVLFSFFVLAKSFLCPDFAVEKKNENRAWYCKDPNAKEDPNKAKQPDLQMELPTPNIR